MGLSALRFDISEGVDVDNGPVVDAGSAAIVAAQSIVLLELQLPASFENGHGIEIDDRPVVDAAFDLVRFRFLLRSSFVTVQILKCARIDDRRIVDFAANRFRSGVGPLVVIGGERA